MTALSCLSHGCKPNAAQKRGNSAALTIVLSLSHTASISSLPGAFSPVVSSCISCTVALVSLPVSVF